MFKKYWGQERSNLWSFLLLHCHLLIDDHILYSDHSCSLYTFIKRKKIWTKIHFLRVLRLFKGGDAFPKFFKITWISPDTCDWWLLYKNGNGIMRNAFCLVRKHDKFTNYCDFFTGFIVFDINNKCTEAHNSLTSNYVQTLLTYLFSYWLPGRHIALLQITKLIHCDIFSCNSTR